MQSTNQGKKRVATTQNAWHHEPMDDYERIARVIRRLNRDRIGQPSLGDLASSAGLSPFYFHRLFTRWAAITPKDFLQCLTLSHAKVRLREGASVLEASLDSGLSGPGRLHDLCIHLEAASPGEWKSGGVGWTLSAGFVSTPFGRGLLVESPRGICHLSFVDPGAENKSLADLRKDWPEAKIRRDDALAAKLATRIFRRTRTRPGLRAFVRGTAFQVRVWRALLQVSKGTVVSYGNLAAAAGCPAAARAVGTAMGHHSLAYLIPCHRVIRETGVVGQYRWGSVRKQAILAWERATRLTEKSADRQRS